MDPKDARAIDIKYHLPCWVKHVQRSHQDSQAELEEDKAISTVSSDIEFYYFVNTLLNSGPILNIADVQQAYEDIVIANGAEEPQFQEEIRTESLLTMSLILSFVALHVQMSHIECIFQKSRRQQLTTLIKPLGMPL